MLQVEKEAVLGKGGGAVILFGDDGEGGGGCADAFHEAEVAGWGVRCCGRFNRRRRRRHGGGGGVCEGGVTDGEKRWGRGGGGAHYC